MTALKSSFFSKEGKGKGHEKLRNNMPLESKIVDF